jgi:hypothetical protein
MAGRMVNPEHRSAGKRWVDWSELTDLRPVTRFRFQNGEVDRSPEQGRFEIFHESARLSFFAVIGAVLTSHFENQVKSGQDSAWLKANINKQQPILLSVIVRRHLNLNGASH